MTAQVKPYEELSKDELYDLLQLRVTVFVIEQNCTYQDLDGKDKLSFHILLRDENTQLLIGTARILPAGLSYAEASIGRVASHPNFRHLKLGHRLMQTAMQFIANNLGTQPVRISAQSHLCKFYAGYQFASTGKEYLEDDIPHTEMLYVPSTN